MGNWNFVTTIVVPCYNEAQRLQLDRFEQFAASQPQISFLFVDDGSKDATSEIIQPLVERKPEQFQLLQQPVNGGKAEAVRSGFLKAFELEPTIVGFWDADLSTPLDELPLMLEEFAARDDLEMVFGARVNLLGRSVKRKLLRHWIGRIFATFVAQMLGLAIYDTQCGAKLFRVTPELKEIFEQPFLSRWIFDVEIIARSIGIRQRNGDPPVSSVICEQPLMHWYDVEGSKLKLRDFITVSRDLVRIYFTTVRGTG